MRAQIISMNHVNTRPITT